MIWRSICRRCRSSKTSRTGIAPADSQLQEALAAHDIVFIGAVEGPITDAYSYMDMELFCRAIYDAPEPVSDVMDCTGKFSPLSPGGVADVATVPLMFMGEDIATTSGPELQPQLVRD